VLALPVSENIRHSLLSGQQSKVTASDETYAVKKYRINVSSKEGLSDLIQIINEVNFIRQLKICENVIQIDSIYSTRSAGSNIKIISIVMNVAKHGSILKLMKS
jgi:hypothetical protein